MHVPYVVGPRGGTPSGRRIAALRRWCGGAGVRTIRRMRNVRTEHDDILPIRRPWDNSGLRNRVEGREIEGVDVLELQSSAAARCDRRPRRRLRRSH